MGASDKIKNTAKEASGKVKETWGDVTNDESLEAEGQAEQVEADVRQAAEKAKDKTKDALD
jgi:uncharacterized protein YjbJ (UPF0337 family)